MYAACWLPGESVWAAALKKGSKSLNPYGGQPKQTSKQTKKPDTISGLENDFIRDPILLLWPRARPEDSNLIFIFCTGLTTLIS